MKNPEFLKQKFNLHQSQEVEEQAERTEARTGERVPQNPEARIQNYLDRFKEITEREEGPDREHGIEALKIIMHRHNVIKPKDIPESYFDTQKRLYRERGHGDVELTPQMREQLTEVVISDQKSTLNNWVEYLSSKDADSYPDWAKYWAFRSMLKLSTYDKEKHAFAKRRKDTVAPFPDLNREALAYVVDIIAKKAEGKAINTAIDNPELEKLIKSENFSKLYAYAIEKVTPIEESELTNTKGRWVKYDKNSDHMPLVESLQGYGTGWCTAGESTAEAQLKTGDFYVYYSNDKDGNPTIPRAAIRMQEDNIAEVRGIAPDQNLDPYIGDIVKKKVHEFPDGEQYEKKAEDMKMLTKIDNKTKLNHPLTKNELIFLYEIDKPIQGFGYNKDPRIEEIRKTRNPQEDAPIIFECEPSQIAYSKDQINKDTKAYIGPLYPNIFQELQNIEHIYTSFPECKIKRQEIEIGGKTKEELIKELEKKNINISEYAKQMINNPDFTTSKNKEQAELIRLTVRDLGFNQMTTTEQIYQRAEELGLELCPAETAVHLRLKYQDQPLNEWVFMRMKQIDAYGYPYVFGLGRDGGGLWLGSRWAGPRCRWLPGFQFVFRHRKLES